MVELLLPKQITRVRFSPSAPIPTRRFGSPADRELYIVVFSLDGMILAHGADQSRVGRNTLKETDSDGKSFNRERVELAEKQSKFWHSYNFQNPVTKRIEPKQMYCERVDQTAVCGGIYEL
jgi:cytochrome c